MARDFINIGPCPPGEDTTQIAAGSSAMKAECLRYILLLRDWFGQEPEKAQLAVKGFQHDFGTYYEVVCYYDSEDEASVNYAFNCEGNEGPMHWGRFAVVAGQHRIFTPDNPEHEAITLPLLSPKGWDSV